MTEGESAFFNCTYDGVTKKLTWIINGQNYSIDSFPTRHVEYQSGQLLEVVNTTVSDNGSTYQCIIQHQESGVAILTVSEIEKGNCRITFVQNAKYFELYSCIFTDIELGTDIENLSRSTSLTMTSEDNQSTHEENIPKSKSSIYGTVLLIFMTYYIFFLLAILIANVMSHQMFLKCL